MVLVNGQLLPTVLVNGMLQVRVPRKLLRHPRHATTLFAIVFVPGVGVSAPVFVTVRPSR
jgi:hypothetical protein